MSEPTTTVPEATTPAPDAPPVPETPDAVADLGDAGKKALAAERSARKAAEKAAADLAAKVQAFEDANKTEQEKAAARAEAAEKRAAEAEAKALRLEIASELNVPESLRKFLTATDDAGLRAQADELTKALSAATAESAPRQPKPDPSQGAKPGSITAQLSKADLAGMTPQQINEALEAGRLVDVLAGKS
jgi:hypothetical protein